MSFEPFIPTNPRTNRLSILKNRFFFWRTFWNFFFCFILISKGQSFLASKVGSKFWWLPWFLAVFYPGQTFCTRVYLQKCIVFSNNFQMEFLILVHCAQSSTAAAWQWRLSSRRGERACLLLDAKYMEMSHCQGNWLPNMDKVNFFCMCVPLRYLARPTYQDQAALKWFGLQSFQPLEEILDILH